MEFRRKLKFKKNFKNEGWNTLEQESGMDVESEAEVNVEALVGQLFVIVWRQSVDFVFGAWEDEMTVADRRQSEEDGVVGVDVQVLDTHLQQNESESVKILLIKFKFDEEWRDFGGDFWDQDPAGCRWTQNTFDRAFQELSNGMQHNNPVYVCLGRKKWFNKWITSGMILCLLLINGPTVGTIALDPKHFR